MAEIGKPVRRRILVPYEFPAAPEPMPQRPTPERKQPAEPVEPVEP